MRSSGEAQNEINQMEAENKIGDNLDSNENDMPEQANQNKGAKMNFTSINPASIIKLREVFGCLT